MSRETMTLAQAAEHIHVDPNELKHAAQRGEIEACERGGTWVFEHRILDEWAQRMLLSASGRDLKAQHRAITDERRRLDGGEWSVAGLFGEETIDLGVQAKAKAGIVRDMTDLAERGGRVYDPEGLFKALMDREAVASTAIGEGVALLHPRFHDQYMFEDGFVAYGRSVRPVFFGAGNGEGTRHFFLICSTDHREHLHILARLAMLAHGTDLVARLDAAESAADVLAAIRDCESEFSAP